VAPQKHPAKPSAPAGRFRRRQVELAEGGKLVLRGNGSITHLDVEGAVAGEWSLDDPAWPRYALRFGLQPQRTTVVPEGRREAEPRPRDG
jgi:hypothetical protein